MKIWVADLRQYSNSRFFIFSYLLFSLGVAQCTQIDSVPAGHRVRNYLAVDCLSRSVSDSKEASHEGKSQ